MRSLFKEAQQSSPCLIFVDELDALGKQRSLRLSGSNDEVEQTLNQMLACMDGVGECTSAQQHALTRLVTSLLTSSTLTLPHTPDSSNNGVVVMGATNRYEVLDPALTRPGRFDRLVRISLPDATGRLAILKVHTRRLKLGSSVDLKIVSEATPGYSGAELAALCNEAAIRAVRRQSEELTQADFLSAATTFTASRSRIPSAIENIMQPNKWFGGGGGGDGPSPIQ